MPKFRGFLCIWGITVPNIPRNQQINQGFGSKMRQNVSLIKYRTICVVILIVSLQMNDMEP